MALNRVVLYSDLTEGTVADVLRRHVEVEGPKPWRFIWIVSVPVFIAAWIKGPGWNDPSRQVVRTLDRRTFRLERRHRVPFSGAFYGSWEAEGTSTKVEGYFGLPPRVLLALRLWSGLMVLMGCLGLLLNLLDITAHTHNTVDPKVGLVLSSAILLIVLCGYGSVSWLGSRRDAGSIAFLEQMLSATARIGETEP